MNNIFDIFTPAREMISMRPDRIYSPLFANLVKSLAVDIHEDDKQYILKTDIPGFDVEDVSVTVEAGVLSIIADKKETSSTKPEQKEKSDEVKEESQLNDKDTSDKVLVDKEQSSQRSLIQERSTHQRLERRINLGSRKINEEKIEASLDKGILTVLIPFAEDTKSRKINIDVRKAILH